MKCFLITFDNIGTWLHLYATEVKFEDDQTPHHIRLAAGSEAVTLVVICKSMSVTIFIWNCPLFTPLIDNWYIMPHRVLDLDFSNFFFFSILFALIRSSYFSYR